LASARRADYAMPEAPSARPAEEAIGAMIASVLGNRGEHDNFFDAGGTHS
jgi:hypothetical protein